MYFSLLFWPSVSSLFSENDNEGNLCNIGVALRCKVCGEDGLCTKDDPYGVSTECPEDKNGCYYSMSSEFTTMLTVFTTIQIQTFPFRNDEQTKMHKG